MKGFPQLAAVLSHNIYSFDPVRQARHSSKEVTLEVRPLGHIRLTASHRQRAGGDDCTSDSVVMAQSPTCRHSGGGIYGIGLLHG